MPFPDFKARPVLIVFFALCAGVLSSCSPENIPGVYRLDVQQGNVITQEMLDQLESGMERRKVRYILGTPMLADTFNENRWDYFYSYSQGHSAPVRRRISVFFDGDKLARVEGDIRPASARRPVSARKETIVTVPPNTGGEGIFSALKPEFLGGKKKSPAVVDPAEPDLATAPEQKTEDVAPAPTPSEDAGSVTSASASPAPVPEPSPRDEQYLQRLFQGFGKPEGGSDSGSAAYETGDPEGSASAGANESDDTTASEGGFLKRLINRLRRTPEPDTTAPDPEAFPQPADSPASTNPEPAAP